MKIINWTQVKSGDSPQATIHSCASLWNTFLSTAERVQTIINTLIEIFSTSWSSHCVSLWSSQLGNYSNQKINSVWYTIAEQYSIEKKTTTAHLFTNRKHQNELTLIRQQSEQNEKKKNILISSNRFRLAYNIHSMWWLLVLFLRIKCV